MTRILQSDAIASEHMDINSTTIGEGGGGGRISMYDYRRA